MIGKQLGPYRIIEEIGRGGMASVYRAEQPSVKRDVAIKLMRQSIANNPDAIQRFQREARLIARLEHIHILPVYDFDSANDPPYIVMRYLEGGTLKEIMTQGILPLDEVAYLFRQVCAAVDYAHRQGIMHRDLKPSNVMVDREGNTFVTDFGIARIAIGDGHDQQITETGAIIGTPDYMSPEQARGAEHIDQRTDIYALGIMLYEMLTGDLPYTNASPMAVLVMHIQEPVPSLQAMKPDLPEALDQVIQRVLAKDPADRYASAADLADALTDAIGGAVSLRPSRLQEAAGTSIMRRIGQAPADDTGSSTSPSEQKKLVTAMYANAVDYAGLVDEVAGSEAARRAMNALWDTCERVIDEHQGEVITRTDNELFALWGIDVAREDDAEQALFAALAMREQLKALGAPFFTEEDEDDLPLNLGLHSGLALLAPDGESGTFSASGNTINTAYRLMQQAFGIIRITHDVYRQVRGVFDMEEDEPLRMRGSRTRLTTYRVEAAKARAFRMLSRGVEGVETAMIGRLAEFKYLQDAFLNSVEDTETQVLTLISEAGLGKSRLLYEFRTWADLQPDRYWLFEGRASANMTERPYALLRDVISFRFQIQDSDPQAVIYDKLEAGVETLIGQPNQEMAHFVGQLVGFDLSDSPHIAGILGDAEQLMSRGQQWLIRLLQGAMRQYPLVMALEDIHQADNASLDMLNRLFTTDAGLPLLVVCTARPALLTRRPEWGSGQRFHRQLELPRLTKRESRELVAEILQKVAAVPRELRDLLVERAEGNPYFMEELVKVLIDDRVIIKADDERWTVELSRLQGLSIPNTLLGLLEVRLDTLLAPEKLTLQRAAVVGRIFYDSALRAIDVADEYHVQDLDNVLARLVANEFIQKRETSAFAGSDEYIFSSNLLRDALDNALLERQRRVFNRAAAEWLVEIAGEREAEYLALIAEYYAQGAAPQQAAAYLLRAGEKARTVAAYTDARQMLERAHGLVPDDPVVAVRLAEVLEQLAGIDAAEPYLQMALDNTREDDPRRLEVRVIRGSLYSEAARTATARRELEAVLPEVRASEDRLLLSRALYGLAMAHWKEGTLDTGIEYIAESLTLAREIGDATRELRALNMLAILNSYNDMDKAMQLFREVLALAREVGHRRMEQTALNNIASALADSDALANLRESLQLQKQALHLARESQAMPFIILSLANISSILLRLPPEEQGEGRVERDLAEALDLALEHNIRQWLPSIGVNVAQYIAVQGDLARAAQLLHLSRLQPEWSRDDDRSLEVTLRDIDLIEEDIQAADATGLDFDTVLRELQAELDATLADN